MKQFFIVLTLVLAGAVLLAAQETLKPVAKAPVGDGTIASGEYQFNKTSGNATIGVSLGSDGQLYLAISAKTAGWVAVGTGTGRMDGSNLFLSALGADGKPVLSEQLGKGHFHGDAPASLVSAWKLTSGEGISTLEISLPADKVIEGGKLNLVWAFGKSPDLKKQHSERGSIRFVTAQ